MTLSIIIPNWNTRALLHDLLRSIEQHRLPFGFEVIVVDNGSQDGSVAMVAAEFPWVQVLANAKNLGYARANNQGFARSQGDYILLLGSDTVVIDQSFARMVDLLRSHPEVGAVSCRLLNPDRTVQQSCRRFPTLGDGILTYLSLHRIAADYNMSHFDFYKTQEVDQPAATCLLVRREIVMRIGLFDEEYTILYNDVDLCMRIRRDGWKIMYDGDAEIIHYGSRSTTKATPDLRLEMYRNILLYYRTHAGRLADLVLRPILAVRLCLVSRSFIGVRLLGWRPARG